MNRRADACHTSSLCRSVLGVLGILLLGLSGCMQPQIRSQAEEEAEPEKYEIKTVRDVASFQSIDSIHVSGVGLVTGLDGTGSDSAPGVYRTMLEDDLKKQNFKNVKEILADPRNSLVLVSAVVPAGAHKGDPIDVEISLPSDSKTTSLHGGRLQECLLYNYDFGPRFAPHVSNGLVKGHALVQAKGKLTVNCGGDDPANARRAYIWGGGSCRSNLFFTLLLNKGEPARTAALVADRINGRFRGAFQLQDGEMAKPELPGYVHLKVPPQYRHNLPHFLHVVSFLPLPQSTLEKRSPDKVEPAVLYRKRLEEDLLDPAHAVTAALRLEALGEGSIPALKRGLKHEQTLVRFCSAEALAYLGQPSCADELARLVVDQPKLRAFGLTALASLEAGASYVKLHDLLMCDDAETRYGAFRALRALNDQDELVQGELLKDCFWVHRVPSSNNMIHVSNGRRAEIVLFGDNTGLKPRFAFRAGYFTVAAGDDDKRCTITRYSEHHPRLVRQCSLQVYDVLTTLADMGGTYGEAVEVLRQARINDCATCVVEADALPQGVSVKTLAKAGRQAKSKLGDHPPSDDDVILNAQLELGATPTLFDRNLGRRHHAALEDDDETALGRTRSRNEKKTAERGTKSGSDW